MTKDFKCIKHDAWISTETLWTRWEEFCNPRGNELQAMFDPWYPSHKLDQTWMSGSTRIGSRWMVIRNHKYLIKRHFFLHRMQDSRLSCKFLVKGYHQLDCGQNQADDKRLESNRATAKHRKNDFASQHKLGSISLYIRGLTCHSTKRRERRKTAIPRLPITGKSGQFKKGSMPIGRKKFKQPQAAIRFHKYNKELSNCQVSTAQQIGIHVTVAKIWTFLHKYFNINKKVQAN